jgi:hypothetical protein
MPAPRMIRPLFSDRLAETSADSIQDTGHGRDMTGFAAMRQRWLQADPSVTLRVYAHVIRDQVAEAADIFARSIRASDQAAVSKSVSKRTAGTGQRAAELGALGGTRTPRLTDP